MIAAVSSRWDYYENGYIYGKTRVKANLGFWGLLFRYIGMSMSAMKDFLWEPMADKPTNPLSRPVPYIIKDIFLYIYETFSPKWAQTYVNPLTKKGFALVEHLARMDNMDWT